MVEPRSRLRRNGNVWWMPPATVPRSDVSPRRPMPRGMLSTAAAPRTTRRAPGTRPRTRASRPGRPATPRSRARRAPRSSASGAGLGRSRARAAPSSGRSSALTNETVSLAHRHDDLGLHDRELALEPARGGLGVGRIARLQAVRAVQQARVDPEPLHRLEHRLAGAAEERDALGELGRSRRVLQQEDVGERVPRTRGRDRPARGRAR